MLSLTQFQSSLEKNKSELDLFVKNMIRYYPASKNDIGNYILIRLSKHQVWSEKYKKWNTFWNKYCDLLDNQTRISTVIANSRYLALSQL